MEFIGIEKTITEIMDFVKNFNSIPLTTLVLVGSPGCGKTSSVYYVADKLGYKVCEYNMSDDRNDEFLKELEMRVRSKTLEKVIFLLDEADGIRSKEQSIVERMALKTRNPIILTANDINKLSPLLRGSGGKGLDVVKVIRFYKPKIRDVVKLVDKVSKIEGTKPNYTGIVEDFRQGLMSVYGSQGYEKSDRYWEVVEELLRTGNIEEIDTPRLISLLDNLGEFFSGVELFDAIQRVVLADRCKTHYPLIGLKSRKRKRVETSYYFEKLKLQKQKRR